MNVLLFQRGLSFQSVNAYELVSQGENGNSRKQVGLGSARNGRSKRVKKTGKERNEGG